jgi:hypothetical protein
VSALNRPAKTMSRSYHVTKKKSVTAFLQGDREPLFATSEKAWIKKKQKEARLTKGVIEKAPSNRAIVAREKQRSADTPSVIRYRFGVDKKPNQPQPTRS